MTAIAEALTNGQPSLLLPVILALGLTLAAIWHLQGRAWALLYVALIPFLNWSFGVISEFPLMCTSGMVAEAMAEGGPCRNPIIGISEQFSRGISLHPMTMVTGMVFVVRDFVQREMGHRVLILMAIAVAWSFFYAWPVIALASGIAFAVSELVDWLVFTFTKYRLSTRILISSALAAPVDTTVFLYGADIAKQINKLTTAGLTTPEALSQIMTQTQILGLAFSLPATDGNSLHIWNWIVFVIGKMVGAIIVSAEIRRRERRGLISAYEA